LVFKGMQMIRAKADAVAVVFFVLLTYYFWRMPHWTPFETVLGLFAVGGLLFDTYYSYVYLTEE